MRYEAKYAAFANSDLCPHWTLATNVRSNRPVAARRALSGGCAAVHTRAITIESGLQSIFTCFAVMSGPRAPYEPLPLPQTPRDHPP